MDLQLKDRVYLVTGGAGGLGLASARALVADGARVVLSGRTESSLAQAVAELGGNAISVVGDNADPELPANLIAAATDTWGRLDGALISVGGPPAGSIMDSKDDDWTAAFGSVFLGAVRIAKAVAGAVADGGAIAFVLSTSVKAPVGGLAISNGLRPGLAMVAKTLADELGPRNIRVNGLLPGRIDTDRVRQLDGSGGDPVAAKQSAIKTIPLGRYGEPTEFGAVAAFLLSPAAGFVSGVMIPVDGGMLRAL